MAGNSSSHPPSTAPTTLSPFILFHFISFPFLSFYFLFYFVLGRTCSRQNFLGQRWKESHAYTSHPRTQGRKHATGTPTCMRTRELAHPQTAAPSCPPAAPTPGRKLALAAASQDRPAPGSTGCRLDPEPTGSPDPGKVRSHRGPPLPPAPAQGDRRSVMSLSPRAAFRPGWPTCDLGSLSPSPSSRSFWNEFRLTLRVRAAPTPFLTPPLMPPSWT